MVLDWLTKYVWCPSAPWNTTEVLLRIAVQSAEFFGGAVQTISLGVLRREVAGRGYRFYANCLRAQVEETWWEMS